MLYTNEAINKRKKRDKKIKDTIIAIIYILLSLMLLYNISLIVQAVINPDETPTFLGIKTYVIVSGSMEPTINIGDIIIVKKTKQEDLEIRRYYFV